MDVTHAKRLFFVALRTRRACNRSGLEGHWVARARVGASVSEKRSVGVGFDIPKHGTRKRTLHREYSLACP